MTELRTAKQFYDFFAAIPVWKWTTGEGQSRSGRQCALGHIWTKCGVDSYKTRQNLAKVLKILGPRFGAPEPQAYLINDFGIVWSFDGTTYRPTRVYRQWTSKGRILAALKDAMKKEAGSQ